MSEERFVAIEDRLTSVETKVDDLGREMRELHDESKREMHALHNEVKREMHALHADSKREMHTLHDDLHRHMGVLHDETIDRIKALAPDFDPIRREFNAADAKLKDDIDQRLTPIEAAIRRRS